jgi:nucleoside-diphosphate-sugar epimerase
MIEHLDTLPDWKAIGVSRRPPDMRTDAQLMSVNLLDAEDCHRQFRALSDVTHIFFAAYSQQETYEEELQPNLEMVRNVVEVIEPTAANLQHIQLIHGSKWYGNHQGPYRTPALEDQPPHPAQHFYHPQRAWLIECQKGKQWTWSILRPHGIWGFTVGSQLNMMIAIAIYATIMKYLGHPLHFPGKLGAYNAIYQCTEASHLARGMLWAATSPKAANQDFNMTNGDFIRWRFAWPKIAEWFDMPVGDVMNIDVVSFMSDKEPVWAKIVEKHRLKPYKMSDLTVWDVAATNMFNAEWDQMSAMTKAQLAGWIHVVDTYKMIPRQLERLTRERIIPTPRP